MLYLVLLTLAWLVTRYLGKSGRKPLVILLVAAGLFYPLITWSALSTFQCVRLDHAVDETTGQVVLDEGHYWVQVSPPWCTLCPGGDMTTTSIHQTSADGATVCCSLGSLHA